MDFDFDEDDSRDQCKLTSSDPRFTAVLPGLPQMIKEARLINGPDVASLIGPLSLTERLVEDNSNRSIQIRSGPLPAFGGVEFRYQVGLGANAARYPITTACLAENLAAFAYSQIYAAEIGIELRSVVTEATERYNFSDWPVQILAIGLEVAKGNCAIKRFATVVDLALLGPNLAPRTVRIRCLARKNLMAALKVEVKNHAKRVQILRKHMKKGSAHWIEDTTSRLIQAAGLTMSRLDQFLSSENHFAFLFDHGKQYGRIEWREGVLTCSAGSSEGSFRLKNNNLTVNQQFPDTLMLAFKGRKLGKIVEHDWLPPDAVIARAVKDQGGTKFTLKVAKVPLILGPCDGSAD